MRASGQQPEVFSSPSHSASPGWLVLRRPARCRITSSSRWSGGQYFAGDFGAPRPQGPHEGNDIMSVRHAPAVAAEAGKVAFETGSGRAGCMLRLYGKSGTEYVYIHLNNDLGPTNDNKGNCVQGVSFAKGLKDGQKVAAGQLVGYVGDSGDADGLQPHCTSRSTERRRGRRSVRHAPGGAAAALLRRSGATFTLQLTARSLATTTIRRS